MLTMFIKGLIIGAVVSAPVGPIGILCVQRTLKGGHKQGIATALGAATSDLIYALIAMFSMSIVVSFIKENETLLQILGSIVIFGFGFHTFKDDPRKKMEKIENETEKQPGLIGTYLSSLALTISNPLVIFLFIFMFAQFNYVSEDITFLQGLLGVCFIMTGAVFWWTFIVYTIEQFRAKFFNVRQLYIINKITGVLLMIIAPISLLFFLMGISPFH